MACFYPLKGYRSSKVNPSGKRGIVFVPRKAVVDDPLQVPCGRCVGCRLDRSKSWAVRCLHEASLHSHSCFLTLTYGDANLPDNGSLDPTALQLFMKRLRSSLSAAIDPAPQVQGSQAPWGRVRYFACGEYGRDLSRPHYHVLLFGYDFPDKVFVKKSGEFVLYSSASLTALWPFGFSWIGDVSPASAAYVAGYVHKKQYGRNADFKYQRVDSSTGEVLATLEPEFVRMSRRPGLGKAWFDKFRKEVYPDEGISAVSFGGRLVRPPRFYDQALEKVDPARFEVLQFDREVEGLKRKDDYWTPRLRAREAVARARLSLSTRRYEQ